MISLAQTSASLFADDYDANVIRRMSAPPGVPAITSAQAVGQAVRALGAKRIALVSPYSQPVIERAQHYYESKFALSVVALEGFAATNSYMIGKLGPENARDAFARINRPEIDCFVVPGGNFPTMSFVPAWEREFGKPVITTNAAALWAMMAIMDVTDTLPGLGQLLEEMPTSLAHIARTVMPERPRHPQWLRHTDNCYLHLDPPVEERRRRFKRPRTRRFA